MKSLTKIDESQLGYTFENINESVTFYVYLRYTFF